VPEAVTSVFIGAAQTLQNAVKADVVDDQNTQVGSLSKVEVPDAVRVRNVSPAGREIVLRFDQGSASDTLPATIRAVRPFSSVDDFDPADFERDGL
jgi:hypothetical protein